jgi:transcriptional regulator with XRE-family HTH domain
MNVEPVGEHAHDRGNALGGAIRVQRLANELTLVGLAERSGLSQPFLSQVENGRSTPSMDSLYRIATALGTTPQALFGDGSDRGRRPAAARADDPSVPAIDTAGESLRRILLPGGAPFHVVELVGLATEFLEGWEHAGFEALYVLAGPIEVEIDGELVALATGDFFSYPSHLPHRYRSALGRAARVLLIETDVRHG